MKLLLDFMYYGEVTVEVDQMKSFIAAAEELTVQGLNNNQNQELHTELSVHPSSRGTEAISLIHNDDPSLHHMASTAEESPFVILLLLILLLQNFWQKSLLTNSGFNWHVHPAAPPEVPKSSP